MPHSLRSNPRSPALLLTTALLIAACTWSVPANPGRNMALRDADTSWTTTQVSLEGADADADDPRHDSEAAQMYVTRCGKCHVPYPPTQVPAARWPFFVAKYGPRAGLFGADRERVLAWLMANAE